MAAPQQSPQTYLAAADLSSKQYYFMELAANGLVNAANAITDRVIGVLQNQPKAGDTAVITSIGNTKVVASASLSLGVLVGPSTAGKAQVAVTTQFPRGIVIETAGADEDIALIELFRTAVALA